MNYAKCATCHGLNSMGFCQYTACRYPSTESGVVNASAYVPKTMTNADRIRSMTDEELADFLDDIIHDWGEGSAYLRTRGMWVDNWYDWLKEDGG